jgi:hypothetical protein
MIASRLGVPLQELQQKTTSSEFVEWAEFLEDERSESTVDHFYLAQIAAVIAQAHSKKGKKVKLSDYLLKFRPTRKKVDRKNFTNSKSFWLGLVGLNRKDKQ